MKKLTSIKGAVLASNQEHLIFENGPLKDTVCFVGDDKIPEIFRDTFPLIGVTTSPQGHAELKTFLRAIGGFRSIPPVPIVRLEPDAVEHAAGLIENVLEGGLGRLAAYAASITGELAMLRRDREALLENYRALEDAFRARSWEAAAEVFAHDPFVDPKEEGIGRALCETGVEQFLPVSSHGVSGIALHFRNRNDQGGELTIRLDYVESDECVAEWNVPFAEIRPRWNFFSLPRACYGSPRTLRLSVSAAGDDPPEPSLGHPVWNARYAARAKIAHPDLADRPLAFRVFTGLPGVRPTAMTNMLAPNVDSRTRRAIDCRLPTEVLNTVTDVSVTPIVPDFQTVYFVEHEGAIICHPLTEGTSAGAVPGAVVSDTIRLSARVVIDHPEGSPAAVALLLVAPTADARAEIAKFDANTPQPQSEFFSGWREVTPQQPININMVLETPLIGPMDLVVVSRAINASVDFCWLKFLDFRLVKDLSAAA